VDRPKPTTSQIDLVSDAQAPLTPGQRLRLTGAVVDDGSPDADAVTVCEVVLWRLLPVRYRSGQAGR
jgi:hypothetical protein